MTAYERAHARWFARNPKARNKRKASGRQPRNHIKQPSNTNNIIRLDKARAALVKHVVPLTLSDYVNVHEHTNFKRAGVNTALPEDIIYEGWSV
jgi:PhoPQ-activated pathogenicity-related protein